MANVGYMRVSSGDQNLARQLDGVELDKVFQEKASAKDTKRPVLDACRSYLREGDVLHVHSIDRLARNLADLVNLIDELTGKGVAVKFHKEGLTFTGDDNPFQRLHLQILGSVAEFERQIIRERQLEGLRKAKAAGHVGGRKPRLTLAQEKEVIEKVNQRFRKIDIAEEYEIIRATINDIMKRHDAA